MPSKQTGDPMRSSIKPILLALCLALAAATQAAPLQVGVLPYLSPRSLLLEFAPLRTFLQDELQQEINILTAPDLPRFMARTHGGDFDLVITAPHFARLAQLEHGYLPLVAIRADFYALLLVPKQAPIHSVREIAGGALHLPHRLSFISLQIEDFLRARAIDPEFDLRLYNYSTDNNAILAAEKSGNGVAAAQRSVFDHMPKDITANLRILGSTQSALSLVMLAHPRTPAPQLAAVRQALARFPYSVQGLRFFETSHSEFVPADAATMAQLDAYLPRLQSRLREKR
jgi:phosphonate transport system substrate-binding protein